MTEPVEHLLWWEAPWTAPPELIRVQVSEGQAVLELVQGAVNPKSVTLTLTAEQAQGLAMKLHEAAIRLSLPAAQAHGLSCWLRDNLLSASGANVPSWLRSR